MAIAKLHKVHNSRKSRNVGLGLVLGLFVVLVMSLTVVKLTAQNNALMPGVGPAQQGITK
ncbi:hypothetical protein [Celeribacter marinus]|uniref:hypothetical protein n=1 Tax=Celeribacter marinus TaxID=1397108 RepID=UPI003F6A8A5B